LSTNGDINPGIISSFPKSMEAELPHRSQLRLWDKSHFINRSET